MPPTPPSAPPAPFAVNELRLTPRQWLVAALLIATIVGGLPPLWERIERFDTGPDYRIPYSLSEDYWLYARRVRQTTRPEQILLLGDSVVWGEYVAPDGTLSHFLNQQSGGGDRFVNAGVNGLFPLAEEGLFHDYATALRGRKLILQYNPLWQTSAKVDLSETKEESFNHTGLVPQFFPRIPCYRADAHARIGVVLDRSIPFFAWAGHLRTAYFDHKGLPAWTLQEDSSSPPHRPNAWRNPFAQITLTVPPAPSPDPARGPASPRHQPWSANRSATRFEWVGLDQSLQWRAFREVVTSLRARGNDVFVIVGPFNEHMLLEENRPAYRQIRDGVQAWLNEHNIHCLAPDTLPTELYADASHPLTAGYEVLAARLRADPRFAAWAGVPSEPAPSTVPPGRQ